MDYYTVLGVSKSVTTGEIRKAYLVLAKKYHPDKFTDRKEAEKMHEKFSLIVKAYKTLLDHTKRTEYDKTLASTSYKQKVEETPRKIQAKMAFKNGIEYYKKGNFWRAEKYFKSAVSLSPDTPLYNSYLGLTLGRQGSKDGALKYCQKAVDKELYNSHFHVNLGIVYKLLDDNENALKCFKEALAWNEKDSRAQEELKKIKHKVKKKAGFFSRFLKKGG
ncbi:MAG: hypothetical protein E3J87_03645 [Candidatus Cloacimonadota bacterium]|nr:MAG: hypothetical protein E3J87_03645 [Candidatus Cloacimonadota bacterium]